MDKYLQSLHRLVEIIKYYNPSSMSLLDIGSKDGEHANFLSKNLSIPNEQIFAIEPNPLYFNKLNNNFFYFNNTKIAFSNRSGERDFYQINSDNDEINGASSLMYREGYSDPSLHVKKLTVNSTTAYEFLNEKNLKNLIVKIDVEGHTYEVLEGFKDKIYDVLFFHIETELYPLWENQKTDSEVTSYLISKGFFKLYSKNIFPKFNMGSKEQYDQIWVNTKYFQPNLNTYFDKIFYLNLDKDTERNKNMLSEFVKWDITNFERIPGFTFPELPDQTYWRNFNKGKVNEKYVLGQLGCRRSHLEAIKIAKERDYSKVLVFEDDITIHSNPHELISKQTQENWDMLYIAGLVEPHFRNQVVLGHAYGVNYSLFEDIIALGPTSGMEIDNFYAKIIQHMSYNYNLSGKYNIKLTEPFNTITQNKGFESNIEHNNLLTSFNKKKCLIFTGAGDNSTEFLSWYSKKSKVFDRALNYYGEDKKISEIYKSYNPEFFFESKGMIFENLIKQYDKFKDYEYILIIDSDLVLDPSQLEDTFNIALKYNLNGCTWSRDPKGFGYFNNLYTTDNDDGLYETNFMEMNFMLLKKSLLDAIVNKISPYNLKWYSGIDFITSAVAYNENMFPFYVLNKYSFYNPPPTDKKEGREIDNATQTTFEERFGPILDIILSDREYFKIIDKLYVGDNFTPHPNFYIIKK